MCCPKRSGESEYDFPDDLYNLGVLSLAEWPMWLALPDNMGSLPHFARLGRSVLCASAVRSKPYNVLSKSSQYIVVHVTFLLSTDWVPEH